MVNANGANCTRELVVRARHQEIPDDTYTPAADPTGIIECGRCSVQAHVDLLGRISLGVCQQLSTDLVDRLIQLNERPDNLSMTSAGQSS